MSTDLYEELGLRKDATQEQVRKAYKKKALLTHPDRLPQGATAAEKAASEEKFRKVNNAYEVLNDPKKRSDYDVHGVWPPLEETEGNIPTSQWTRGGHHRAHSHARGPSRGHTFPDPFFSHHHHHAFEFTDPFTLFESIFEGTPFGRGSSHHRPPAFGRAMDPYDHLHRLQTEIEGFMNDIDRNPFGGGFPRSRFGPTSPMSAFPTIESSPFTDRRGGGGRWVSESYMTSSVNGVTQTIHKRTDSDGNEHITRTLPDGREYRTINGVEQQQPHGHLPYSDPSKNGRLPEHSSNRYLPPTTSHPPVASTSRMTYRDHIPAHAPPPYPSPPQVYHDGPAVASHRRTRTSSDKYIYASNSANTDRRSHDERHHKRHWWQGVHQ